jgi:hypothetical protein
MFISFIGYPVIYSSNPASILEPDISLKIIKFLFASDLIKIDEAKRL